MSSFLYKSVGFAYGADSCLSLANVPCFRPQSC